MNELLATGRAYIEFARETVFPHAEETPGWAGDYAEMAGVTMDRGHIDRLETSLDEASARFDA